MGQGRGYTKREINTMRDMAYQGHSLEAIAERLGRSRTAVRIQLWRRGHSFGPAHVSELIDTPKGRMTRRDASIAFGIPFGTLCRRIWEGCPADLLFKAERVPKGAFKRPATAYGTKRKPYDRSAVYVEKWADRKKRRAKELAIADQPS
jgi:hypothetical protein